MRKKFIIAVNAPDKNFQDALTNALKSLKTSNGCGYWHWLDGLWLLTDPSGQMTALGLRNIVRSTLSTSNCLIFEVGEDSHWAGFGKTEMFNWLHETWSKKE